MQLKYFEIIICLDFCTGWLEEVPDIKLVVNINGILTLSHMIYQINSTFGVSLRHFIPFHLTLPIYTNRDTNVFFVAK